MTAHVDVLVDPHDDVATTRAIHCLATEQSRVLAVSVAPDERTVPAVVWAILRALGKRTDKLPDKTQPDWHQAKSWLRAHLINELIVLRAQHLKPAFQQALTDLAEQTSSTMTLVYSGPGSTHRQATITLDQLLERPRTTPEPEPRSSPWPRIPRSHPWRLRYDCAQTLNRDASILSTRADLLYGGHAASLVAAGEDHRRALLGHRPCGADTHPGGATGDQRPFVLQIHYRHPFSSWNMRSKLVSADPSISGPGDPITADLIQPRDGVP